MRTAPEVLERWPGPQPGHDEPATSSETLAPRPAPAPGRFERLRPALAELRWPLAIYFSSRVLYLLIALLDTRLFPWNLGGELSNWDGLWYWRLAGQGYPTHVAHIQTTLGFFPLYPALMWLVSKALMSSLVTAGVLISTAGGAVTTVLVQRLSAGWWGEEAGRRAVVFFCLFPGSIVFSMVYAEGVMIALVAGCILALQRRRWLLAGSLAAFATATGPQALAIIPACAVAAIVQLRRRGWRAREARRALLAPLLAPIGVIAFGAFLWIWTGSPFASFIAQHDGWDERTDPLALVHVTTHVAQQISFIHFPHMNLNYVAGLVGAVFLAIALVLLYRTRPRISAPALTWTLGIAFLTVTSENVPPNPRLLIAAFPAVVVVAYRLRGRAFRALIAGSTTLLVAWSIVSFVGNALRP